MTRSFIAVVIRCATAFIKFHGSEVCSAYSLHIGWQLINYGLHRNNL